MKNNIKNLDSLLAKLENIGEDAAQILQKSVNKGLKVIQRNAKYLSPVNDGELRNSIQTRSRIKDKGVEGDVYTNCDHAGFVEFGTGPKGEANAPDVPPDLNLTYKQDGWWIHVGDGENEISQETVDRYHFYTWTTPSGEKFVYTKGQAAQPYLYPALIASEEEVMQIIAETTRKEIIKAVKKGG